MSIVTLGRVSRLLRRISRLLRVSGLLRSISRLLLRVSGLLRRYSIARLSRSRHSRRSSITRLLRVSRLLRRITGLLRRVSRLLRIGWLLHHRLLHHWLLHHGLLHHRLHHGLRLLNDDRLDDGSRLGLSNRGFGLLGNTIGIRFESSFYVYLSCLFAFVHESEPFFYTITLDELGNFESTASNLKKGS